MAFTSMKDLLPGALTRAKARKGVEAAQIVGVANRCILELLGSSAHQDVKALSFRDGKLLVGCLSGAAAQFMHDAEHAMIEQIKQKVPSADINRVATKVVSNFQTDGY